MRQEYTNSFLTESYNGVSIHISHSDMGMGWSLWLDDELIDQALLKGAMERETRATMDNLVTLAKGLIDNLNMMIYARLSDPVYNFLSDEQKRLIALPFLDPSVEI